MEEFEKLYDTYFKRVFAFLLKMTGNYDLSEELTQETFYQAFTSFSKFKGNSDIFTWLATIAKRCYYKHIKKQNQVFAFEGQYIYEVCAEESFSKFNDDISRRELSSIIKSIIDNLPKMQYDVVILRIYADLSFKEIANSLNISENSAKVTFFRAKNTISKEIQDEFELWKC